jgi:ABC-type glycerol-3-phosphate transport system substrate-binding protein
MKKFLILALTVLLFTAACAGEQSGASEPASPEVTVFRAPT